MNAYEPIFKELADNLLKVSEIKPNYSDNAMLDVTLIFQSVFMDKIFDNQDYDDMGYEHRSEMVEQAGKDLRKLIHTYTGLDTVQLVKNYLSSKTQTHSP
jgi:hypothetical protein